MECAWITGQQGAKAGGYRVQLKNGRFTLAHSPNMNAQGTMDSRTLQTDKDTKVTTGPLGVRSIAINAVLNEKRLNADEYGEGRNPSNQPDNLLGRWARLLVSLMDHKNTSDGMC